MNWTFWLVVGLATFGVYVLPKLFKNKTESTSEVDSEAKSEVPAISFFGGPLDGLIEEVPDPPQFLITPYIPKMEDDREGNVVGVMGNTVFMTPNFAYYTQVTDDSYFYVRDVNELEIRQASASGQAPDPEGEQ